MQQIPAGYGAPYATAHHNPNVDVRVEVQRTMIPETRLVQVPQTIPTSHVVMENVTHTIGVPRTVYDNVQHTVYDQRQVFDRATVYEPRVVQENVTVTEQVPRQAFHDRVVQVPRVVPQAVQVQAPRTIMEPVQRQVATQRVVPEQVQVQQPRLVQVPRQVVQPVQRQIMVPRQAVQHVPRTIYGQRQQIDQHVIHTARVVETPQITEVELPQVIQQVIPGRARQYMGPARVVGQVAAGQQFVGTVDAGQTAAPFVAPTAFATQTAYPGQPGFASYVPFQPQQGTFVQGQQAAAY
jgi:hypothetical protein